MKTKTSYRKNLSLPIISFMATVLSTIFYGACTSQSAIAQVGANGETVAVGGLTDISKLSHPKGRSPLLPRQQQQLIAQVWSDIATEQLSWQLPA
ncbi:MAG: hypothetical protein HC939_07800 [Pleurocapsa sp. SU_5_0]|nr:hypothetical protein [Pleurocapsa sp. SU_5_0]